ncbi:hypothetical protein [Pleurocapsa sp. FMAR1]|uniref:hypothetical protein n=1 Tax=Pleurocapsa sp. FMAR1 TaxID=3040204 RepID=UPI0029C936FE|nr:hypothetical protein [Pleurocapsa sp. FMAR1]
MFNAKYSKITTSIFTTLAISLTTVANFANIAQAQLFPEQTPTRDREYNPPRDREYNPPRNREYYPTRDREYNPSRDNDQQRDRFPASASNTVPEGFVIPIEYDKDKILVTPKETTPVTLLVAANVRDSRKNTLIPYGSEISGNIQPSNDETGSLFVADEVIFPDGTSLPIEAISNVITRTETVKKGANAGDILKGAAIGGGAAAVLSEIFGDIGALKVLGGAGAGALAGLLLGGNKAELISIDPNNDLDLTVQRDFTVR